MKLTLYSLLVSLALLFTISSCKKSNPVGPSNSQQILPLKIGDTWLIEYTVYDTTEAIEGTMYDTAMVKTDTVISGVTWHRVSSITIDGVFTDKSDGLWGFGSTGGFVIFRYPANVGDTWNAPMNSSATYEITLESDSASVTVPKGTYVCYDYRMLLNSLPKLEVYLSPGVGFVAMDVYSTTKSGRSYKQAYGELTSLILN